MHRPTRWGYAGRGHSLLQDSNIKNAGSDQAGQAAISQFRDMINRLEGDGYQVMVIPKSYMDEAQVKAFCDRTASEKPAPATA